MLPSRPPSGGAAGRWHVEEKEYTVAWHYRNTEKQLGLHRLRDILDQLIFYTANNDLQVGTPAVGLPGTRPPTLTPYIRPRVYFGVRCRGGVCVWVYFLNFAETVGRRILPTERSKKG